MIVNFSRRTEQEQTDYGIYFDEIPEYEENLYKI
jgi:hypothetical protein